MLAKKDPVAHLQIYIFDTSCQHFLNLVKGKCTVGGRAKIGDSLAFVVKLQMEMGGGLLASLLLGVVCNGFLHGVGNLRDKG